MPHSTYQRSEVGHVVVEPARSFLAGAMESIVLTYTAGRFGIDDTGGIKIAFRQSSDMDRFQSDDPTARGYVTATASNGAVLSLLCGRYNTRPYQNTVFIRVVKGFLRPGEEIRVVLGDRVGGSPGIQLQTSAEKAFPLKVLVDAFAVHDFVELEHSPGLDLEPGAGTKIKILLPGRRKKGVAFRIGLVPVDRWTNPTETFEGTFRVESTLPIEGLPTEIEFRNGSAIRAFEEVRAMTTGELRLTLTKLDDPDKQYRSNPLWIGEGEDDDIFWTDLHAQSGETVGAGTADEYFRYARDKAFIEATSHQGNDFQITDAFWDKLNRLYAVYNDEGRFVTLPGYEWSANTGLGGDHNVFFVREGEKILRSSKVLSTESEGNEYFHIKDLLGALDPKDALLFAHVGGRYADLEQGHDGRLVRAVEIHSSWGTFEWILHDALKLGHRPGVVANSDDHKCRPGLTTPGAGTFGAMGGLTAYKMPALTRANLIDAIRKRNCYGTTGARILIDLVARFASEIEIFEDDPALGPCATTWGHSVSMGQVVSAVEPTFSLQLNVAGTAPIERIDIFDGETIIKTVRPWEPTPTKRVRVLWQGAEYRGRGRETRWDGSLSVEGNRLIGVSKVNDSNPTRQPTLSEDGMNLSWRSITTGNLGGLDLVMEREATGFILIETTHVRTRVDLSTLGYEPQIVNAGGLARKLSVYLLPEEGGVFSYETDQLIDLPSGSEHAVYVRITQEDGHQAWTSPIYLLADRVL